MYLAFLLPFILAYLSWQYFPQFATWLIQTMFRYQTRGQAQPAWYLPVRFFYTWYTFCAIGLAGAWAIAAALARKTKHKTERPFYSMVSFITPAYNEEKNIARCIQSIFKCAEKYDGLCEIIVVDDGSTDHTYEIASSAIAANTRKYPRVRGKVIRHSANVGKAQALETGLTKSQGDLIAVVDADSWWCPNALVALVDHMIINGRKAVTGFVRPSDGNDDTNLYILLQQLEYGQGLGTQRCAQSLGDRVLIVSGAIGLYETQALRDILAHRNIRSVTEDLELTLRLHAQNHRIGYVSAASSSSVAPSTLRMLWNQRQRWFMGWLHNSIKIHRPLLLKRSWTTFLLWYCLVFEYAGAFIDIAALVAFPFLFWFAPDRLFFAAGLLVFIPYSFLIGVINQAIALKLAYGKATYRSLLLYAPYYPLLRLINILARLSSSLRYLFGNNGSWHHPA
jgi:biofilm PGA synthesis N-glycosyltransferase PgaC